MSGVAYISNACGVDAVFTASQCGNTGGTTDPGGSTDMNSSGFPYTIAAAGNFKMTANGGAASNSCQITASGNYNSVVNIWLGGFTLTGRMCLTGNFNKGINIFGGGVTCAWTSSGADAGCIRLEMNNTSDTAWTAHHLTLTNTQDPGSGNSAVEMHMSFSPISYTGTGFGLQVYNITSTTGTATGAARRTILNVAGPSSGGTSVPSTFYNLNLTTGADSQAVNGIQLFGTKGTVVRNSVFTLNQNVTAETGRAVAFDCDGGTNCSDANTMQDCLITANNNRGVRERNSTNILVRNVKFLSCRSTSGCIHTGDETGTLDMPDPRMSIFNSSFEIFDGYGVWGRGLTASAFGKGINLRNNTATCSGSGCGSGHFAVVGPLTGSETTTVFDLQNNAVASGIGASASCTGGTATNNCTTASSVINYCGSGTTSGAGTNTATTCP